MNITGTHINYYFICHRKLWLFANGIHMEHNSELVAEGKLIHDTSYPNRAEKYQELELEGIKIDYYDRENKVIHEIKKTGKIENAHEWQVKYYLYMLAQNGISDATGLLEYPKLKQTKTVDLTDEDKAKLTDIINEIRTIIHAQTIPARIKKGLCKNCSYHDFCWVGEDEV